MGAVVGWDVVAEEHATTSVISRIAGRILKTIPVFTAFFSLTWNVKRCAAQIRFDGGGTSSFDSGIYLAKTLPWGSKRPQYTQRLNNLRWLGATLLREK